MAFFTNLDLLPVVMMVVFIIIGIVLAYFYAQGNVEPLWISIPSALLLLTIFVWTPIAWKNEVNPLNTIYLEKNIWGTDISQPQYDAKTNTTTFSSMWHTKIAVVSATNLRDCHNFTPTIDKTEVVLTLCFDIDTSKYQWIDKMKQYNRYSEDQIKNLLWDEIAQELPKYMKDTTLEDLSYKKSSISETLYTAFRPSFDTFGFPLNKVVFSNYSFTNPDISKAYEAMAINIKTAENKKQVAQLEAEAAIAKITALNDEAVRLNIDTSTERLMFINMGMGNGSSFVMNNSPASVIPLSSPSMVTETPFPTPTATTTP